MAKAAPAAKKVPAKTVEAEEKTARPRGPKGAELTAKITVLSASNPKREGSKAAEMFKLYKTGLSVGGALDAGITTSDLIYNASHGFISIEGYEPEMVAVKEKPVKVPKEPKGKPIAKKKAKEPEVDDEDEEELE